MSTATQTGWEGILADDENILWQGQPDRAIVWSDLLSPQTFMGLFFCVFSAFWLGGVLAISGGFRGSGGPEFMFLLFPIVGSVFFCAGLYMLGGRLFWDAYARGHTYYTLTTKGAYIATSILNRKKLKHYSFDEMSSVALDDEQPGSVWFAEEIRTYRSSSKHGRGRTRTQRVPIGFRRIPDARGVYRQLRNLTDAGQP